MEKTNNVALGDSALYQVTTGNNNFCLGKNAGWELTNENNQVRIGNFTPEEVTTKVFKDCYIGDRFIIKRDVLEFLGFQIVEKNGEFIKEDLIK